MARPLRIDYPGAWHHVTCRGNEKKKIFSDDHDRIRFLEILAKSVELYEIEVHAYVLMNNHFHLLLTTPQANLRSLMQRFNTAYTVYYNRRHRRVGHLYQGRYKAILVDTDPYLLELSRYLHLNPVRIPKYSQLDVEEKREIIRRYCWSSYPGYVRMKHRQSFVNYEKILEMVGKGDDRKGRKRYEQFVIGGILKDMNITFWQEVKGQAILGSDEFVDRIYERFLSKRKVDERELPGLKELKTGPETMEEIAQQVALEFGVPAGDLYRKRAACRVARSIFMELCRVYLIRKMSHVQIGLKLGGVSVAALTQNIKRLSSRLEDDSDLRRRFHKLVAVWG
ncbi:MAG: transposase [Desulfobacterales bacterium]|nr:transposase [Desulfobacterales bacterium]